MFFTVYESALVILRNSLYRRRIGHGGFDKERVKRPEISFAGNLNRYLRSLFEDLGCKQGQGAIVGLVL